jgi:DNA-binding CsgD family transcriptional regulator/PAS domain-containing protein
MDELSELGESTEGHARWVAMWGEAVSTSALAIGLVQLSSTRFVAMSHRAAELLRTTPARGVGVRYLSVTDRPREAAQTFRLVREGLLDGLKGRRRFQLAHGSSVEMQLAAWAIRSRGGPDLGLWIASEAPDTGHPAVAGQGDDVPPTLHAIGPDFDGVQITLNDRWRIAHIGTSAGRVLGRPPAELLASSIIDLTQSDDHAVLLLGFARATTEASADVRVRMRHQDGSWRTVQATISLLDGDGTLPFAVVMAPAAGLDVPDAGSANQLAVNLRRIASQIETAGILAPLIETATSLGIPATADLSARQWEIASRLVQGQRVATIAAEMYLSQSTVRNHLSAIFQKFGVHSQAELLALWRAGAKVIRPLGSA